MAKPVDQLIQLPTFGPFVGWSSKWSISCRAIIQYSKYV